MKIFITPWIDLTTEEIGRCIEAGAESARIHTGKLKGFKIVDLIRYYSSINFKFYLDLRGNKANTDLIDGKYVEKKLEMGEKVIFYDRDEVLKKLPKCDHLIKINFIPEIIKAETRGNLNVDDGAILFDINKVIENNGRVDCIETQISLIKQPIIYPGDGVSSTNIYIHSNAKNILTKCDMEILRAIPNEDRKLIKYITVSFCENGQSIIEASEAVTELGFVNAQIVPKVETIKGIANLNDICVVLRQKYGDRAELQIGRGDLSLDCAREEKPIDYNLKVDEAINVCKKHGVILSVLSLVLQSVRKRHKINRQSQDYTPSHNELLNLLHLKDLGIYQIGLTNDMYIDHPEKMVEKLREVIQ